MPLAKTSAFLIFLSVFLFLQYFTDPNEDNRHALLIAAEGLYFLPKQVIFT